MSLDHLEEWQKAQRGELFLAFSPELLAARESCNAACNKFNSTSDFSRRNLVKLWAEIRQDKTPLPAQAGTTEEDDQQFEALPYILPPLHADYGFNVTIEQGAFINFNATFVDTCPIRIGARTLVGPNCSFYSGTHPVDPAVRNGTAGPELGSAIDIGEDCWLGGNVVVLPGVTIGKGCTIGAGSVVTKSVPAFHVAAGNPARVLRKIDTAMDPDSKTDQVPASRTEAQGPEETMAKDAAARE